MAENSKEIAPGVAILEGKIVNLYFVGEPGQPWTLVDTGMPGGAAQIRAAAAERYGENSKPSSILLTHAHFDHIGSAKALADLWDVPIYVHPLEMPFVTRKASYPPFAPTVGGFFPFLSRFFPEKGADFGDRVRTVPPDGELDGMPGWSWHFTPGHAPGHIALFRPSDRTLIAGDAFITMNTDLFRDFVTHHGEITRPPTYATYDWDQARRSVAALADLKPTTIATGHGPALSGPEIADQLMAFSQNFPVPTHGRYVPEPARVDAQGNVSAPPPVPDPFPAVAAGVGGAALAGVAISRKNRR